MPDARKSDNAISAWVYLLLGAVGLPVLVILAAYIDAKCIRVNDFFVVSALVTASIHIMDMGTDVSFALTLLTTQKLLFVLALCFILVPALVSLFQLHCETKKWRGSDEMKQWLAANAKWLFLASAICGSAFTAVRIAHSNLFRMSQFELSLSKTQLGKFQSKELFSTVLLEVCLLNVDGLSS